MTIKIQHPFKKTDLKHVEEWLSLHTKGMTITVHRLHAGQCWFEATSEHAMDFYKLGMFTSTWLEVANRVKEKKRLIKQAQEN